MARWAADGGELLLVEDERPRRDAGPWRAGDLAAVGEVTLWNRADLARLVGSGVDACDGELLTALVALRGVDGLALADGAFCLCVREPSGSLLLARDAVGERTCFYGRGAASSSLRALPGERRINLDAVAAFLTFAYVPGEDTLLEGVRELLPGRWLRLHRDGTSQSGVFWEPGEGRRRDVDFRAVLEQAVARRLPSGPANVLLSGGIDSGAVTAVASHLGSEVHTWSISFGDELPNERGYAELVAAHCGTTHRTLNVSGAAVAERLVDAMAVLDDPVGDPLTVPNLLLDEAIAAAGYDVLLNGEGGDPVLGGPKNLPMLVYALQHPGEPLAGAYLRSYRKLGDRLGDLLSADVRGLASLTRFVEPYLEDRSMKHLLHRLLHTNLRTKGAHHILPKVDRLTSAAGVEGRSPLFDRTLIDAAFSLPPQAKLSGTREKAVLKDAVADLLPDTVVERPKSGMRVPVQAWLDGPLEELADDLLLGPRTRRRGLLSPAPMRAWLNREGALYPRHGQALWLCLSLELWLRAYVDGDAMRSVRTAVVTSAASHAGGRS